MDLKPHRLWMGILALAVVIGAGHAPFIDAARQREETKLATMRAEQQKTMTALNQLRDDIAATEKLKTKIDAAEAEQYMKPVNRLRTAKLLERRAAEARLSRFSYILSPESKTPVETIAAGTQNLASSQLSLTAETATDIDAYIFLDSLRRTLPGRFSLRQFSLERMAAPDAPIAATNLRLIAKGEWLSNGAAENLAENTQ